MQEDLQLKKVSFWKMLGFILMCTFIGFGGGNALLPIIKKYSVTKYGWLTEEEFEKNVVLTNILPGPSVIESLSYVAIKMLGFKKGIVAVILGSLPHVLFAFILFYFSQKIPRQYLYSIEIGVLTVIIASLIVFSYEYFKKAQKSQMNISLWFILFLLTFLFCLFIPSPWNMPVGIMILIILIFTTIEIIKKKQSIKKLKDEQEPKNEK